MRAHTLTPFLDPDRFEIVGKNAASQFTVALNRWDCMDNRNWLISVTRRNLVFAAVVPGEGSTHALRSSLAGPPQ